MLLKDAQTTRIIFIEGSQVATPTAGTVYLFFKDDHRLYAKYDDDSEAEIPMMSRVAAEYLALGLFTAKGSLAVAAAAGDPEEMAIGPDGYILMADSSEYLGVRWAYFGWA